jgi:hypothetical protein
MYYTDNQPVVYASTFVFNDFKSLLIFEIDYKSLDCTQRSGDGAGLTKEGLTLHHC